jgi:thiamine monophosphate kinase
VLIHEVRGGTPYLLRSIGGDRAPVQSLNANGVQITVDSLSGDTASVSIRTDIVDRCQQGWVWREANPEDLVCVTGDTRGQAAADNAVAASR